MEQTWCAAHNCTSMKSLKLQKKNVGHKKSQRWRTHKTCTAIMKVKMRRRDYFVGAWMALVVAAAAVTATTGCILCVYEQRVLFIKLHTRIMWCMHQLLSIRAERKGIEKATTTPTNWWIRWTALGFFYCVRFNCFHLLHHWKVSLPFSLSFVGLPHTPSMIQRQNAHFMLWIVSSEHFHHKDAFSIYFFAIIIFSAWVPLSAGR